MKKTMMMQRQEIESEESDVDVNKETASEKPVVISRSNLQKLDRATSKLALKTGKELKPRIRKPRVTNPLKVARKNKTFKPLILTRRAKSAASGRVVRNSRKTVVNLSPKC